MVKKYFKRVDHTTEMSFLDHLTELRDRLLVCVIGIIATTLLIGLPLSGKFIGLLILPLRKIDMPQMDAPMTVVVAPDGVMRVKDPAGVLTAIGLHKLSTLRFDLEFEGAATTGGAETEEGGEKKIEGQFQFGPHPQRELYYFSPFDPFFLRLKAALLLGVALAIPIWLTQLWMFVAPAFTPKEMRAVRPVFFGSVLLFPLGAAFAYFSLSFILQMVLNSFHIPGTEPRLEIARYFSLILMFMLVFGGVFETPIVVVMLVRMGVVSTKTLRSTRQYALLGIAILSAALTPADPVSMFIMAIPVCILYEASIWISVAIERRIEAESEEDEAEEAV